MIFDFIFQNCLNLVAKLFKKIRNANVFIFYPHEHQWIHQNHPIFVKIKKLNLFLFLYNFFPNNAIFSLEKMTTFSEISFSVKTLMYLPSTCQQKLLRILIGHETSSWCVALIILLFRELETRWIMNVLCWCCKMILALMQRE